MQTSISTVFRAAIAALVLAATVPALGVSCTTQSQLSQEDMNALVQASKALVTQMESADVAGVKANTIASTAAQFDGIASQIQAVAPQIQGATLTVENLYLLNAMDLKAAADETQFFCGAGNAHEVVLTIPQLPPGQYALAILHASGVKQPQQATMILQRDTDNRWKLAGLFIRPLTAAGHDGLWYWTEARKYAKTKENWNAYFYLQTAGDLLAPVNFLTSPNLDKLIREQTAVTPAGLPGAQPMKLTANGQTLQCDQSAHGWLPGRVGPGGELRRAEHLRSGGYPQSQSRCNEGLAGAAS